MVLVIGLFPMLKPFSRYFARFTLLRSFSRNRYSAFLSASSLVHIMFSILLPPVGFFENKTHREGMKAFPTGQF
jgi:hypothetical protein